MEVSGSLINKICSSFSGGLHFAKPIYSLKRNEVDLVRGVLQIVQGFSNSLFYWDHVRQSFYAESGIYVTHLSQISLQVVLNQFIYAATCLKLIEIEVSKLEAFARSTPPTLRAFACSISSWLSRLRETALKEEVRISSNINQTAPTLLGLANSLSSVCSGAEFLWKIVHEALPQASFEVDWSGSAADIAVHILDYLYNKLNEVCLVQGGEEDAYSMILHVFVGSLLPYVEGLDSWLFEGILDDPFEEMFFYSNRGIAIDEVDFWEKSYLLRPQHKKLNVVYASEVPMDNSKKDKGKDSFFVSNSAKGKEKNERELKVCPLFIKDIGMAIISAGKSLQLIRHAPTIFSSASSSSNEIRRNIAGLALTEGFCVSLASLIGHSEHISNYFWQEDGIVSSLRSFAEKQKLERNGERLQAVTSPEKIWYKFLFDALSQKRKVILKSACEYAGDFIAKRGESITACVLDGSSPGRAFQPENPCITVCQKILDMDADVWSRLNLSRNFYLPPLNDYDFRNAIFGGTTEPSLAAKGTNYASSFLLGESSHLSQNDARILEALFPFPTLLPSVQEDLHISEFLPFQKNSTLPSKVMSWIQCVEPKATPLPVIILQECLIVYIKRQVDSIGKHILSKLLYDWRLLDELGVLRDIYLLGSGDLLQHFLTVIFSKLDKGESWDDDFELNTILQESIRNSADGVLLSTPDSLVVSFTKDHVSAGDEENDTIIHVSTPCKNCGQGFGINGLESLKFTYKVPWPLELIANTEAIKKYNQVMSFLLKVKRAKFVLDKARRWMWKDRGIATINRKHQWLVEQKLLHFVDAFHQYVMDRVYHSAWLDLCEGMAAARSLDVVIDVHEAYLLSIQRQCFVVPDKLWALIASRINSILGLALDFYSAQQTLNTGGAVSAIKARCEMEVDRIERHFDDCIAFLLRVLSFKLNVGQFPHLADLVTRINYNYFYMSNSGNLVNAPVSDTTTSKLGKAFPVRKE